jgi:hypothetical protein
VGVGIDSDEAEPESKRATQIEAGSTDLARIRARVEGMSRGAVSSAQAGWQRSSYWPAATLGPQRSSMLRLGIEEGC